MKKIFIIIISLSFSLSIYSQVKYTVTDSVFVRGSKFVLIETEDGVAEIKAFYKGGGEAPISGVIKMAPPVYFIKENYTNKVFKNDFGVEPGDIATVFMIIGNEASKCNLKSVDLKKTKDNFYGRHTQGVIVVPPQGIFLTDFMHSGLGCVKSDSYSSLDLYDFLYKHFDIMKRKKGAETK